MDYSLFVAIIYSRMDLLDQYIKELGEDTSLDEFTVRDVQMKLPAIKHKWTGRLMRAKIDIGRTHKEKNKLVNRLVNKLMEDSPVKLGRPIAQKKVQEVDAVSDLQDKINETKVIIEFLEKAERILNSMTFDIKNLTEIMKLETN